MGSCTVPAIFGFKRWFDARYDMLCRKHDAAYKATCNPLKKLLADGKLLWVFGRDVLLSFVSFMVALVVLPTLGTVYWAYHRICERYR